MTRGKTGNLPTQKKRLVDHFLAAPIFIKILGIGLVVSLLFWQVTQIVAREAMERLLYERLAQMTRLTLNLLARQLERPLSTGDYLQVDQLVQKARELTGDLRYILVQDREGRVVAHTFDRGVPPDLLVLAGEEAGKANQVRVLDVGKEFVLDAYLPILQGRGGRIQVGLSDRDLTAQLSRLEHTFWWILAVCGGLGTGLALLLTAGLTRPLRHLMRATARLQDGDYAARAQVFFRDEVGELSLSFNRMAESLQRYQEEVSHRERERAILLDRIVQVQEEERRTLSRELHDELGQSLSTLLMRLTSQTSRGETIQGPELVTQIREQIARVRELARGMRPSLLDDFGLEAALRRLVEEYRPGGGKVDYQYQRTGSAGTGRLPPRVEETLYRVAQEALTNFTRHAQASRASVVVFQRPDEVLLIVEDDGRGFDLAEVQQRPGGGLGLIGIRERIALCGGQCVIETAPGQGTVMRVTIPLPKEERCPSAS